VARAEILDLGDYNFVSASSTFSMPADLARISPASPLLQAHRIDPPASAHLIFSCARAHIILFNDPVSFDHRNGKGLVRKTLRKDITMRISSLLVASVAALTLSTAAFAGNSSSIIQNGNGNGAQTFQRGRTNDSQVVQFGDNNAAGVYQRGRNNNAGIGQNGNGNWAEVHQRQSNHW
jgi:hypothetical protein